MDPFSLGIASVTIGEASISAVKFSVLLYKAYRDVKDFDESIKRIALRFRSWAGLIEAADHGLRGAWEDAPASKALEYIQKRKLLKDITSMTKDIRNQIDTCRAKFERIALKRGTLAAFRKLKWTLLDKPEISLLHPEMDSLITTVTMLVNIVQLEVLRASKDDPRQTEKIKRLEKIIQNQEETIRVISKEHLLHRESTQSTHEHVRSVDSMAVLNAGKILQELGKSMREEGTVPKLKRKRPRRRESSGEMSMNHPPPPPVPQPQLRRSRPTSSAMRDEVQPRQIPRIVIPETALKRHKENERQATEQPRDSLVSEETELTRRSSTSTTHTTPESPNTPTTPGPVVEASHDDVHKSTNQDNIVDLDGTAEQFYIVARVPGNRHARRPVTAKLFPTLSDNFICELKAGDLGLDVTPLDSDEATRSLLYGRIGKKVVQARAVGSVTVSWWESHQMSYKNLNTMHMWVMEGLPEDLSFLLGQPFVERRRPYIRDHH